MRDAEREGERAQARDKQTDNSQTARQPDSEAIPARNVFSLLFPAGNCLVIIHSLELLPIFVLVGGQKHKKKTLLILA